MSGKQRECCMMGVNRRGLLGEMHREYLGDEPQTLTRCHGFIKPLGVSHVYGRAYKGKICFLGLLLFYCRSFHGMMHADSTVAGG